MNLSAYLSGFCADVSRCGFKAIICFVVFSVYFLRFHSWK